MTTETILTDEQIYKLENTPMEQNPSFAYVFARAIEQAVLQSLTEDARVDAAARALSRCLDYPWEFMTSHGHHAMRDNARAVIKAAMRGKA